VPQAHCCTTRATGAYHPIHISCITRAAGASLHYPRRRHISSGSFIHLRSHSVKYCSSSVLQARFTIRTASAVHFSFTVSSKLITRRRRTSSRPSMTSLLPPESPRRRRIPLSYSFPAISPVSFTFRSCAACPALLSCGRPRAAGTIHHPVPSLPVWPQCSLTSSSCLGWSRKVLQTKR
jgi:hypothetical protein